MFVCFNSDAIVMNSKDEPKIKMVPFGYRLTDHEDLYHKINEEVTSIYKLNNTMYAMFFQCDRHYRFLVVNKNHFNCFSCLLIVST